MEPPVPIVDALAEQHAALAGLLAGLEGAGWDTPSRCPGWTVADVVLHLAQSDEMAVASLRGTVADAVGGLAGVAGASPGASVDEMIDAWVASERGATTGAALHERWQAAAGELRAAAAETDPHRRVQWVAGQMAAQTLVVTRVAENWIHTGDVADALGREQPPSDGLWHVARLAWRMMPYAFGLDGRTLSGPVAFELTGPGGDAWSFVPDEPPATVVRGDAVELCEVAARRVDPAATGLRADGPDGEAVLALVRTYA